MRRLAWLLLLAAGCPGKMIVADQRQTPLDRGDGPRIVDQKKVVGDQIKRVDLPVTPGVPCLSGACGPNLICMANICLKMCTQPTAQCNDKVATCSATEACMFASSFTDACYPASAKLNEACDYQQAIYCVQGTLCVKVGTSAPRCLKLCKYTCPTGTNCGTTSTGCQVCVPP